MKLFSIMILYRGDPAGHLLKAAYDLTSFGFFQRGTVQEFINMTAKILVERTQIGERQSVKEKEYTCHVFVRSDSLAGVCLSDDDVLSGGRTGCSNKPLVFTRFDDFCPQ